MEVKGVQLDEAHSKRRPGQVEWIHTALAMQSLFTVWVEFGARTTATSARLIAQVVARVRELPLVPTDGWKCYKTALLQVVGRVYHPRRKGNVGRKPKPRLMVPDHLFYAQVIKVRDTGGRVVEVTRKVLFGDRVGSSPRCVSGGWAPPFRRGLWNGGMAPCAGG